MSSSNPALSASPPELVLRSFGLKKNPFGMTPDPEFLYLGEVHQEAIARLRYGILSNRGFLALVANPGMGKTTLLYTLREQVRFFATTALIFQTQCSSRELLRQIASSFGLKEDGSDLVKFHENFRELLDSHFKAGRSVLLCIDEAQRLDDEGLEAVRLLSNFENPDAKLLQIILSGQPQLSERLASPQLSQLRQRISLVTTLTALTTADVHAYARHRLGIAGATNEQLFSSDALDLVATLSRGIPRVINNLCFNSLSVAYAVGRSSVDRGIVEEAASDNRLVPSTGKRMHPAPKTLRRPASPSIRPPTRPPVNVIPIRSEHPFRAPEKESRKSLRLPVAWIVLALISLIIIGQPGFRTTASNIVRKVFSQFVDGGSAHGNRQRSSLMAPNQEPEMNSALSL